MNKYIRNMDGIERTFVQFLSAAVTLVPYGCTELRLTVFPVVKSASCCQRTDTAPQQAAIRKE